MSRWFPAAVLVVTCVAGGAGLWYYRHAQARPLLGLTAPSNDWLAGLESANPQTNAEATKDVRELGARALPVIQKTLNDPTAVPHRKKTVIRACALIGLQCLPAMSDVVAYLAQPEFAAEAAMALSLMGADAYAPLADALESEHPQVRCEAARALGKLYERAPLEASAVVPPLLELLADADPDVRQVAATYLGIIHEYPDAAIPALSEMLQDEDAEVRLAAARALGEFGPAAEPAMPALRRAQGDKDENVAREAGLAVVKLQAQKLPGGR